MANRHCKAQTRSVNEKFQPQDTLSALNSDPQNPSEHELSCDHAATWQPNPTHIETNLAYLRLLPWWRLQIAVLWFTGTFPKLERLKPCSVSVLSLTTLAPPNRQQR